MGLRTAAGRTAFTEGAGRGALGLAEKGGLRGLLGRVLLGKKRTGFDPLRATGERTWRNRMMGQGGVGPVVTGSGFIGAGELGKTALLRGSIAALAARGLLGKLTKEDVAGMSDAEVEQEAGRRGVDPPAWTGGVEAMADPSFAWRLPSLQPHLMRVSPLAYKRRNVFVASLRDQRR